jgi:hypothetical protein
MGIQTESRVSVKLFVGCHLNTEMKMLLNQSSTWKQVSFLRSKNKKNLIQVPYQTKDYLGCYLVTEQITLFDLKKTENFVKELLKLYCPDYDFDSIKICIFPQLFVA